VKRFTSEEDREFEVVGEVFMWRTPWWGDVADTFDKDVAQAASENGQQTQTMRESIQDLIDRIEEFIDPEFNDGVNRWKKLAGRKDNPVPYGQFGQIYQYLISVAGGNPTEQPSPSPGGQRRTAGT
jgi:hypothetical protein